MFEFTWPIFLLLGGGLLFVILEVLFPSAGLLGIGAAICLGFGGYYAAGAGFENLISYCLSVVVLAPVTVLGTFKILPHTPLGKRVILPGPSFDQRQATEKGLESLVGHSGTAETHLRPAGIAIIDRRRVDVITRGERLEAGETIRVVKVEGNRVIVGRPAG